jgi:glyoxylase-like metal-dependent hydrolase (beta-lactamase superfamily II)
MKTFDNKVVFSKEEKMKLFKIEAGSFHVDGGAAFGVVPKKVWQKRYPADEENFCKVHMRCLLVQTEDKLILIDTGTGDKQLEYLKYYGFEGVIRFDEELNKLGFSCEQVTDVVFTHLHFDHCGGATQYNEDKSEVKIVFPNAMHWVGENQWENFKNPNVREGDSYFPENLQVIADAGKLKTIDTDTTLCSGIEMKLFNGHTKAQIAVYINAGEKTIVYAGDVIPLAANVPVAWLSSYDVFPLDAMIDKQKMLQEAVDKNQILYFEHDAYTECCTVKAQYNKYKVDTTYKFDEVLGML